MIGVVAKTEIRIIARSSRWVSIWILFVILSFASYAQSVSASQYVTVPIMGGVIPYDILALPLIGIFMGFDLASGDVESNRTALLLSHPISRRQLIAGKLLGRLILVMAPLVLSSAFLLLLFAEPLSIDLIQRFTTAMLVLTLGASFYLGLCAAISVVVRRTVASLVYCFTAVLLFSYQFGIESINLIPNAVVSLLLGTTVVPDQQFPNGAYMMQIYGWELFPDFLLRSAYLLFQKPQGIWSWLIDGGPGNGLPVYLLLIYLLVLAVLLIMLTVHKFENIDA
jgi:ABC-2 type transport system permease protein